MEQQKNRPTRRTLIGQKIREEARELREQVRIVRERTHNLVEEARKALERDRFEA